MAERLGLHDCERSTQLSENGDQEAATSSLQQIVKTHPDLAVAHFNLGTVYANLAATVGATLAFLVTRYLLRDAVLGKFGPKLEGINRELEERGLNYLLFLRLVPLFPFFLINLAAGLTRLPLRTFFFGTMLGIIPGGFVYVNAGASLATINSLKEIASPRVLGSFALLGLFALVPVIDGRIRKSGTRDR